MKPLHPALAPPPPAANPPHAPLASTVMRNQLLEAAGWRVISIPFSAWAQLATLEEQHAYLRKHVLSQLGKGKGR